MSDITTERLSDIAPQRLSEIAPQRQGDIAPQRLSDREQLIQELSQAPDDLVQAVLEFLHRVKGNPDHPLAKFAGILSDSEAEELQESIRKECRQVDLNEW